MMGLWIIMKREFAARFVKKGYWLFTIFGLILMIGLTFLPTIMNFINQKTTDHVVFNDPHGWYTSAVIKGEQNSQSTYPIKFTFVKQPDLTTFSDQKLKAFMKGHHTHAVVIVGGQSAANPVFTIEQKGSLSVSNQTFLKNLLQRQVMLARIQQLKPDQQSLINSPVTITSHQLNAGAKSEQQLIQSQLLVYFMEVLLMMTIMIYGAWVAQGVIEEKSNRIIEMLLISVRPWQILFGKVLGIAAVAFLQYALWTGAILISLGLRQQQSLIDLHAIPLSTILMFPVFFLLGYLIYAVLFAIGGSVVHRAEEQQMAVAPVSIVAVLAFYGSMFTFANPESTFAKVLSFIPLFSPLTMFARMALGAVPAWQVAVSIGLTVLFLWGMVKVGARIYRRFALKTSGRSGWGILFRRGGQFDTIESTKP